MSKTMKGIGVIKELSNMLAQHSLITIYKAIIRSHLDDSDILYDQPNNESLCQEIESIVKGVIIMQIAKNLSYHLPCLCWD